MSFSDYSNKKKKKDQSFSDWSNEKYGIEVETKDEDIAPVKEEKKDKSTFSKMHDITVAARTGKSPKDKDDEKWYDNFLQLPEAFKDGYQFGDVTKTILGTNTDIATNLISGVVGWGEDVIDAGTALVGTATEALGWDKATEKLKEFAKKDLYDPKEVSRKILSSPLMNTAGPFGTAVKTLFTLDDWLSSKEVDNGFGGTMTVREDNSFLGDDADAMIESAGEIMVKKGLQVAAGGIPIGDIITGVTVYGSQAEQALKEDATFMEASGSGLISAGAEIIFEKLSGGIKIGGATLDAGLTRLISQNISSVALRTVANGLLDVGGEALEEVATEFFSKLGTKLYKEEDLADILFSEEALQDYAKAAFTGGFMGGAFNAGNIVKGVKGGYDYKTGLKDNENAVVNKEYEKRIAEEEKNGKKLTAKQKSEIYQEVMDDLKKGYISTDTIEETLGGEDYKTYKDALDSENALVEKAKALTEEYNELNKMKLGEMTGEQSDRKAALKTELEELNAQIEANKKNAKSAALKAQLSKKVYESTKGTHLTESYFEIVRSKQKYTADLNKYEGKAKEVIKQVMESGLADNSNQSHEFWDIMANLAKDRDTNISLASNEQILEMVKAEHEENGWEFDESKFAGQIIDGYVSKNGIVLNAETKRALNFVVGHEITHTLEKTKSYKALQEALFEYAKDEYESRYNKRAGEYGKQFAADEKFKSKVDMEVTGDLVGDYLFTDKDFVTHLSTKHQNVFQQIWDEIKHLCKLATAGSAEARQLEKVKHLFEKAYKESGKVEGTKLSVSENKIINKLTGEELDANTYQVLDRLSKGENVSSDEIANLKEVKEGDRKAHELKQDFIAEHPEFSSVPQRDVGTYLLADDNRVRLRNEIISKRLQEGSFTGIDKNGNEVYNGSVKQDKRLDIVIGLPASGKSSSIVNPLSQYYQSVVIDSDIIKRMLPEFNDGWGGMLVHEESSQINAQLLEQSMNMGNNIVLPIVGSRVKSVERYIAIANKMGYNVNVHLNELSNGKAVGRMLQRYFDSGRFINPTFVADYGNGPTEVYEQIKQRGDISGYSRWNNDVPRGQRPILVGVSESNRLYASYSDAWGSGRGEVSGRLAGSSEQTAGSNNEIAPIKEASSTDGVFFDGEKPKYSLSEYTAEEKKAHNDAVVEHFGKTYKWAETGYLLLDGTRLDLSGKHDGAPGGYRTVDHRDITEALGYDYGGGDYSGSLIQFMSEGNIRVIPEINGINLSVKPTKAQEQALADYISRNRGEIVMDIDDLNGNTVVSIEYPYGTRFTKVLNDIREWFDNGKKPESAGSYSLTKEGETPKRYGRWNVYAKDIMLDKGDVAPVDEAVDNSVAPIDETVDKTVDEAVAPEPSAAPLADIAKQARREELQGAYNHNGKQYISDGSFIAELNTVDESLEQSESFPIKRVTKELDEAFERKLGGNYALDTAGITDGYIKVGNSLFDAKYVNAVTGAIENPVFTLSHVHGGDNALLVTGDNGRAVLMPVRAGENVNVVYEAQEIDGEVYPEGFEPAENAYTIERELESVREEMKAVFEEYNALREAGKDAEAQPLFDKFMELNERGQELYNKAEAYKAEEKSYLDSLTDADAPPEVDAPYYEDGGIIDPFEERDIKEVGSQKVKAYMYENPEVKPYFQKEAKILLGELDRSTKGERYYTATPDGNANAEYGAESYGFWSGTSRDVTPDIAQLLDDGKGNGTGYTYDEIRKGINAIIEDNGKENNACSKRIEFIINDRLMNGYTTDGGYEIEANQEYRNMVKEKGVTAYNDEARAAFFKSVGAENIAPVDEDIAPTFDTTRKEQIKGQQTVFEDAPTVKDDIAPTAEPTAEAEPPKVAKVLESTPKKPKKANLWQKIRSLVFDKQSSVEDISLKTHNRELMGKADFMLRSESRAQRHIQNKLMPILEKVEATGNRNAYETYVYHLHNVDRMSLEGKAQARMKELEGKFGPLMPEQIRAIAATKITEKTTEKTANTIREAKEWLDLLEVKNKPVFADEVTADVSREFVKNFEAEHKDAREFAEAVTEYNGELRQMLVDAGVISQETADLWAEMYPHYAPIRRAGKDGAAVIVPLDSRKTGVNAPIKRATGGNSDMESLLDVMGMRTEQVYRAIARNSFGLELMHSLDTVVDTQSASVDEVLDTFDNNYDELLQEGKNGANPTFTVFEDGKRVTFEITEELYDALKPTNEMLKTDVPVFNLLTKIQRGILTQYNPTFIATNAIKDIQDVIINSQHAAETYKSVPLAVKELFNAARGKEGKWIKEYLDNGGDDLTVFDSKEQVFKKEDGTVKKVLGFVPNKIAEANDFVEKIPRLAEYIASRKAGASIEVAMLDAARVTTNFAAGGDLTKWVNKNGFTFLNASVQGAKQQWRNVREAKANGLKGVMKLAAKYAIAGLPLLLLNHLLWDDDEDYEELSDYVKDNYYIVAKYGDGKFVRIPKGRAVAVIQNAFEQMKNLVTGDDEADFERFAELAITNLAPNDPLTNNVLAPFIQAKNNKTWYGEDLVPTRLQDMPTAEQYDETTDSISKWLGELTGLSPYKINYVLDQYSGGLGDVALPYLTPESDGGGALAPFIDKFTTDSVMKNQNVSNFYDTVDELTKNANSMHATEEDILKSKYMNSVRTEISELYAEKRAIQASDLSDKEKSEQVRDIQKQIDALAKESLGAYSHIEYENALGGRYAVVGDRYYEWYEPKEGEPYWRKLDGDQVVKYNLTKNAGNAHYVTDGNVHYRLDEEGEWVKISDKQLERQNEVTKALGITPEEYWSKTDISFMPLSNGEYEYAYDNPENYAVAKAVGGYDAYRGYSNDLYNIKADKDANGKSINGSRKEKVIEYINNLDADFGEKIILFKSEYPADDTYNREIVEYLNSRDDISYEEMETILKELGFTIDSQGNIYWD